jgi:putative transcriptional regulator
MILDSPHSDLTGRMLVATPETREATFRKSVIVVCAHSPAGALGVMINRPATNMTLRRLFSEKGVSSVGMPVGVPIFAGGPDDIERVVVLHAEDGEVDGDATEVTEAIRLTPHLAKAVDCARTRLTSRYLIALGHCTWDAGGIESELARGRWLLAPATPQIVFTAPPEDRWDVAMSFLRAPSDGFAVIAGHA